MAQVTIRNLDEQVVHALKTQAELADISLEQRLRQVLAAAARFSPEQRLAWSRGIRAMTPPDVEQTDSAELVREARDSR